jgi:hypothetical protein
MKRSTKLGILSGAILTFSCVGFFVGRAVAGGIPATAALVYTGQLQNGDGTPFVEKDHNIEIKLWNDPTSTDASALLCHTSSPTLNPDVTGHFSLSLGDDCTAKIGANPTTYIEVFLDGAVLGGKRTQLGAVPYAIEANHAVTADHATTAATAASATAADNASAAASASVAANALALGGDSSDSFQKRVGDSCDIGIGTIAEDGGVVCGNIFVKSECAPSCTVSDCTGSTCASMCARGEADSQRISVLASRSAKGQCTGSNTTFSCLCMRWPG